MPRITLFLFPLTSVMLKIVRVLNKKSSLASFHLVHGKIVLAASSEAVQYKNLSESVLSNLCKSFLKQLDPESACVRWQSTSLHFWFIHFLTSAIRFKVRRRLSVISHFLGHPSVRFSFAKFSSTPLYLALLFSIRRSTGGVLKITTAASADIVLWGPQTLISIFLCIPTNFSFNFLVDNTLYHAGAAFRS